MTVWIVSIEWNTPPSEVTGDTGIVGVYARKDAAERSGADQRAEFHAQGQQVYQYCGPGCPGVDCPGGHPDDWDIDIHVTEHEVQP